MKRICPICRKPNLEGQQIICLSCKADSPYTLLEGYSSTVRISDELEKIEGYKEKISSLSKSLKSLKYLSIVLGSLSVSFLIVSFLIYINSTNKYSEPEKSDENPSKLEFVLDSLEKETLGKDVKLDSLNNVIVVFKNKVNSLKQPEVNGEQTQQEDFQKTIQELNTQNATQEIEISKLNQDLKFLQEKLDKSNSTKIHAKENTELVHVVKEGESLYTIAKLYYGNGMKYLEIAQYNQISDPQSIRKGERLKIKQ